MEEKVEFGYVAQPPGKKGKLGSVKQKERNISRDIGNTARYTPRESEMLERVLNRVKLPNMFWDQLLKDIDNKEPKNFICRKYNVKPADLKWIKKYLGK
jgi:hypothetical protein